MKKLTLIVVLVGLAVVAARALRSDAPDEKLVFDRIWLDHLPANDRDMVHVFAVLRDDGFGVFQSTSRWKGEHELFQNEPRGGKLVVFYPQSRQREEITYRAGACDGGEFEYCLELKGASRGVKKYVSKKGWEIGSRADLMKLPPS